MHAQKDWAEKFGMFEVNGEYENRKGKYTVLAIEADRMHVRYSDGSHAELNMEIQGRIWENILVEKEAEEARANRRGRVMQRSSINTRYFIKSVSVPDVEELMFPGWQERLLMAINPIQASRIKVGDRIIYYAIEADSFFAVATITGESTKADPKEYFFKVSGQEASFFPVDIDTTCQSPHRGISRTLVELEDYPDFRHALAQPENFFSISEDDFEMLAELLTELNEGEENGMDEEDFEEEDEE